MGALILLLATFALFWLLFVRPQQARLRAHQQLVASLAVGDDVVTTGGLFGTVTHLDDEAVTLQVATGVEVRVARQAIGHRQSAAEPEPEPPPELDTGGGAEDEAT